MITLAPGQARTLPWMQFYFRAEFDGPNRVVTLTPGTSLPAAPPASDAADGNG